ncbi:hypothetical protein CC80DRAFT_497695, partial [Byssothecium circinans]
MKVCSKHIVYHHYASRSCSLSQTSEATATTYWWMHTWDDTLSGDQRSEILYLVLPVSQNQSIYLDAGMESWVIARPRRGTINWKPNLSSFVILVSTFGEGNPARVSMRLTVSTIVSNVACVAVLRSRGRKKCKGGMDDNNDMVTSPESYNPSLPRR